MAKKKELPKLFTVSTEDQQIILKKEDIVKLTKSDNAEIKFYVNTLGFDVVFIEEEPKVKHYFNVVRAEKYIKKHDKDSLAAFQKIAEGVDKKDVKSCGDAFRKQKEWFIKKYGKEAYDEARYL